MNNKAVFVPPKPKELLKAILILASFGSLATMFIFLDSIDSGETDLSQKSINTMFNNDQVNSLLYAVIQSMRDKSNIKIYSENL